MWGRPHTKGMSLRFGYALLCGWAFVPREGLHLSNPGLLSPGRGGGISEYESPGGGSTIAATSPPLVERPPGLLGMDGPSLRVRGLKSPRLLRLSPSRGIPPRSPCGSAGGVEAAALEGAEHPVVHGLAVVAEDVGGPVVVGLGALAGLVVVADGVVVFAEA